MRNERDGTMIGDRGPRSKSTTITGKRQLKIVYYIIYYYLVTSFKKITITYRGLSGRRGRGEEMRKGKRITTTLHRTKTLRPRRVQNMANMLLFVSEKR